MRILYISPVKWSFLFQRHQALAIELSRNHTIYFLNPPDRDPFNQLIRSRSLSSNLCLIDYSIPVSSRNRRLVHGLETYFECKSVVRFIGDATMDRIILADLRRHHLAELLSRVSLHYDVSDFPVQVIEHPDRWIPVEESILSSAVSLTAASRMLEQRYAQYALKSFYLPNGYYAPETPNAGDRKKNFIFSGALFRWINTDFFNRLNDCGYSVDIAGKVDPKVKTRISSCNDFLGVLPHGDLSRLLTQYRCGIIPFEDNLLTRYSCPIKVHEYLKSGCNVLGTAVPEIMHAGSDAVFTVRHDLSDLTPELMAECLLGHPDSVTGPLRSCRWEILGEQFNRILCGSL